MIKCLTFSLSAMFVLSASVLPRASASTSSGDTAQRSSVAPEPKEDKNVRELVDGMRVAGTWGHPDQFGEYKGMVAYTDHDYKLAMQMFRIGARYADKVSQLSIGLMYLNGQGVVRDPVKAWAWTSLSAERGYPAFKATRVRIWQGLSRTQRVEATAVGKRLATLYADAVAKPRMARQLREHRNQITGSHTGFDSGVTHEQLKVFKDRTDPGACMRAEQVGLRGSGCGDEHLYADENWDPGVYFKTRDAQYMGTVTVGAVEKAKDKK